MAAVGRDFSKFAITPGVVTLQIQSLRRINELDFSWQAVFAFDNLKIPLQSKELICIEDQFDYVLEEDILSMELNVCLDYLFDGLSPADPRVGRYDTFIIRRIFNKGKMLLRPLNLSQVSFVNTTRGGGDPIPHYGTGSITCGKIYSRNQVPCNGL